MRKRYLVLGLIVVLAAGWLGYSTYVFNLERFQPAQQTVVMTSDTVGAGGKATAHVRVVGRKTSAPLTGAHVTVYRVSNGNRKKVAEGETGTAGNFSTTYRVPNRTGDYTLRVVTSSSKGRDAVTTSIRATRDYQIFVDTDKPVYKPGQDMTVRALVQHRQTGSPMTDTATAIVEGPKGNQLLKRNISLNSYGMGQLTFPISEAGRKGRYRVEVRYRGEKQVKTVNVREYRLPRFEVGLDPAKEYYRPGETFTATINAQYFFGKPVTDARVRVVGEGYIGSLTRFDTVTTTTNDNGIATVSMELPSYFAGSPQEGGKGFAVFNVSVTSQSGHTERITKKVTVADQDILIDAFPAGGKLQPGVNNTVYVSTRYPDGEPARTTVTINGEHTVTTNQYGIGVFHIVPSITEQPTAQTVPRERFRRDVRQQNNGERFHFIARDNQGNTAEEDIFFKTAQENRIALRLDRATYEVGDTVAGRVYVGKETGYVYIDVINEKNAVLTRTIRIRNGTGTFSFEVTPAMRGDITVRAWSVFQDAHVARVGRTVLVDPGSGVRIDVRTGQETYRPGERAQMTVTTSKDGKRVPAAIGIDIVDESVFSVGQARAGLAAVNFAIEQDLLTPKLFVHGFQPTNLTDGKDTPDERTVQRAVLAQTKPQMHASAVNSIQQNRKQIQERQQKQKKRNTQVLMFLLVILPLSILPVIYQEWRGEEAGERFAYSMLAGFAGLVTSTVLFIALLAGSIISRGGSAIFFYGIIGIYSLIAGFLLVHLFRHRDHPLLTYTVANAVLYLGLIGTMFVLNNQFTQSPRFGIFAWLIPLTFLIYPTTFLAGAGSLIDRGRLVAGIATALIAVSFVSPAMGMVFLQGLQGDAIQTMATRGGLQDRAEALRQQGPGGKGATVDGGGDTVTTQGGKTVDVRQFFPETLYSSTIVTGPDGAATVNLTMADSITTWRVSSFAATREGSTGSARDSIRVFQPFFMKPDIPLQLTQRDQVSIPVSVFNYKSYAQNVTVTLRRNDWFTATGYMDTVQVPSNSVRSVSFTLTARENGGHDITFVASTDRGSTDAVRKHVTVAPYGKQFTETASGTLSGTTNVSMAVPKAAVDGSARAVLRLYPGTFGQVVQGIERLFHMPNGCFEQTSSSLYPDILALRYLEATDRTNPEIRMTAERFISQGYQRLLTFETSTEGGYSLFGRGPPNLLLTAYGLMEMSDMDKVYPVDQQVINEMQRFITRQQRADGSWPTEGSLEYAIGIGNSKIAYTAYVTWALAHSGSSSDAVDRGIDYIAANLNVDRAGTMTLAVALNSLVDAEQRPDLQTRIAGELEERAIRNGDTVHWKEQEQQQERYYYPRGGNSVLVTATIANALQKGNMKLGLAEDALRYLVKQKSGHGGWGSTHNTVMALKALTRAEQTGVAKTGTIRLERNGEQVFEKTITAQTRNEVHTILLNMSKGQNRFTLTGPENSGFYYEMRQQYHLPWQETGQPAGTTPISLDVSYDRRNLTVDDTVQVNVEVGVEQGRVGMALVQLGIPPGFTVETGTLNQVRRQGTISRYEIGGRQLTLYLEQVQGTRAFSFEMRATQPVEASTGPSTAYDYYNPTLDVTEAPVRFHVVRSEDGGQVGRPGDGTDLLS